MTPTRVKIPRPLRSFANGASEVSVEGTTVGEVVRHLVNEHPGLEKHLFTPNGELRSLVTLYVNDEDIRYLQRGETPLHKGDTLTIVPAIAGGGKSRRGETPSGRSGATNSSATVGISSFPRSGWRVRKSCSVPRC